MRRKKLSYLKAFYYCHTNLIKIKFGFSLLPLGMRICEDYQLNSGNINNAFSLKSDIMCKHVTQLYYVPGLPQ